jgi:hypothetical protein
VEDDLWSQAQLALNGRGFAQGRKSKTANNLFVGVAFNARDGYKLTFRDAQPPRRPNSRLLSLGAISGWLDADYGSFPYAVVEAAILSRLAELDVAAVFPDQSGGDRRLAAMKAELDQIEADLKRINEEMAQPRMVATLLPAVRRLVGRKNKLAEDYEALNARCVAPDADQLHSVQEMLADQGFNPTDEGTRLRLRAAIRRVVAEIWLLGVSRGRDRLMAAQLWFTRDQGCRDYLIFYRPPQSNVKAGGPVVGQVDGRRRPPAAGLAAAPGRESVGKGVDRHRPDRALLRSPRPGPAA